MCNLKCKKDKDCVETGWNPCSSCGEYIGSQYYGELASCCLSTRFNTGISFASILNDILKSFYSRPSITKTIATTLILRRPLTVMKEW